MDLINCKKKRGAKMPYQCEICGNYKAVKIKDGRDIKNCGNNTCYKLRQFSNGTPRIEKYKPYTNSKKEIELTCNNFSHIRVLKAK